MDKLFITICGVKLDGDVTYQEFKKTPLYSEDSEFGYLDSDRVFFVTEEVVSMRSDWKLLMLDNAFGEFLFIDNKLVEVSVRHCPFLLNDCITEKSTEEDLDRLFKGYEEKCEAWDICIYYFGNELVSASINTGEIYRITVTFDAVGVDKAHGDGM